MSVDKYGIGKRRSLLQQVQKKFGIDPKEFGANLEDLDDSHLQDLLKKKRGGTAKRKRGGTVKRKSGGKIMQGYKAGGKV